MGEAVINTGCTAGGVNFLICTGISQMPLHRGIATKASEIEKEFASMRVIVFRAIVGRLARAEDLDDQCRC